METIITNSEIKTKKTSRHKGRILGCKNKENRLDEIDDVEAAAEKRRTISEKRKAHSQNLRREKIDLAEKEIKSLIASGTIYANINSIEDGRKYSKDKIQMIQTNISEYRESIGFYKKPFPKVPEKQKEQTLGQFPLTTPALKEANDRGILNMTNYNEIKKGGLVALEKFSGTSMAISRCYAAIETSVKPIVYVINRDEYDAKLKLQYNKNVEKFRIESKNSKYDYDQHEYENMVNPSLEAILA